MRANLWAYLSSAMLVAIPGAAAAQQAADNPESQSQAGAAERPSSDETVQDAPGQGLPDIVVTATKRSESVQNIPLSISAIGGDTLKSGGVHDMSRLDKLIPGFKFGQSGNDARPAIRGTRTQQVVGNADPLVAFYNDGIYRSRPGQALDPFFDVGRVEVARGPQGTLFGRNSFGGAINVINRAPAFGENSVGTAIEVGSFNGVRAEGFANVAIGEDAALRLSAYTSRRDGWVRNAGTGGNPHDDNNQVLRGQLKVRGGGFDNVLRAEYWHGGGVGPGDFGYYTPGVPINPATRQTNGVIGTIDPVIAVVPGRGGGYAGLTSGTRGNPDWRHIATNFRFDRNVSQLALSDEANVDLGFADLRGVFSYTDYREYRAGDPDYSTQALDAAFNRIKTTTSSEELQLISKPGGPLTWVLGAYALQDRPSDQYVFGDDRNGQISLDPALNRRGNLYVQGPFRSDTNSIAFYGDGTYEVVRGLKLIGGIRWTQDKRKATIANVPFAGYAPSTEEGPVRRTFEKVTWRAGAQFQVAPRSMVYGTYSTGFLAGGFSGSPSFSLTASSLKSFDPTTARAIEIGSKNTFFDGRLRFNLSAYSNIYDNIVTQRLTQVGNAILTETTNAGTIRAWGVEGELDYYPVRDWQIGLRGAYTNSRFGDYVVQNNFVEGSNNPNNTFQLRGLQVPLNPDFTATAFTSLTLDAGDAGAFTPFASVFYSGRYRTADQPYFFANQRPYAQVDLSLGWAPEKSSRLRLEVFVNNLTDRRILLRSTPNGGSVIYQDFAPPRMIGGKLSFNY